MRAMRRLSILMLIAFVAIADPVVFDPAVTLNSGAPTANERMGHHAVAVDGDQVLSGGNLSDVDGPDVGIAWIHSVAGGPPTVTFRSPDTSGGNRFGFDVDFLGTSKVLIGSPGSPDGDGNPGRGRVYVMDRATGALLTTVENPTSDFDDQFGWSVAAVGTDRFIAGAIFDDAAGPNAGAAYLFEESGALLKTFHNPEPGNNGASPDRFGEAVAAVGTDSVVIGAPFVETNGVDRSGAAFLFGLADASAAAPPISSLAETRLESPTPGAVDLFGFHVAGIAGKALVSANREDVGGVASAGRVYVFNTDGSVQATMTKPVPSGSDLYGRWVAAHGTHVLVSAFTDDTLANNTGQAFLYDIDGNLRNTFDHPTAQPEARFGWGVALTEDSGLLRIAVAAPRDDVGGIVDAGSVYVFSESVPMDSDGDGLLDAWETVGFVAANGTFVDLPAMGADPQRKDVFVEIDYMTGRMPTQAALDLVVAAFANAPVSNPDGSSGITLHCIVDDAVPFVELLGDESTQGAYDWQGGAAGVTYFQDIKDAHFTPSLAQVAHYCVIANRIRWGFDNSASGISRGAVATGFAASDFIISLGGIGIGDVGTVCQQAGTFMHELGHDLGLQHGGGDATKRKPNYLSVMNYYFQFEGLVCGEAGPCFDFSRAKLPDLNENALDESAGIGGVAGFGTKMQNGSGSPLVPIDDASGAIDWNADGDFTDTGLVLDLNGDNLPIPYVVPGSVFVGFNDWANLVFAGGAIGATGATLPPPPPTTEPPEEIDEEIFATLGLPAPENLKGHPTDPQTTLTWRPVTDAASYNVYRTANGDVALLANTVQTNYHDRTKVAGIEYVYSIASIDEFGAEGPSTGITVTSR